jgi:uncharacterized membrane protein YeiH
MKRAKLLLSAIAIFAVAGAALAFKANRGAVIFCSTTTVAQGGVQKDNFTITPVAPGVLSYCTVDEGTPIAKRTLITALN